MKYKKKGISNFSSRVVDLNKGEGYVTQKGKSKAKKMILIPPERNQRPLF